MADLPSRLAERIARRISEIEEKTFNYLMPESEGAAVKYWLVQALGQLETSLVALESLEFGSLDEALSLLNGLQIDVSRKHLMMGAVAFLNDIDASRNHFLIAAETARVNPQAWMLTAYLSLCHEEYWQAKEIFERVLILLGEGGDNELIGRTYTNLGVAIWWMRKWGWGLKKRWAASFELFSKALEAFQQHQARTILAIRHVNLAYVLEALGKSYELSKWKERFTHKGSQYLQQALEHYLESARIAKDLDAKELLSLIYVDLSFYNAYGSSKDDGKCAEYLSKALTYERQLGRKKKIADIQGALGIADVSRKHYAAACINLTASYNFHKQMGNFASLKRLAKIMKKTGCPMPP